MSPEQAKWLASNRKYRAAHQAAGNTRFAGRGILHADGTFSPIVRGQMPRVTQGCFEVGILQIRDVNTGEWRPA